MIAFGRNQLQVCTKHFRLAGPYETQQPVNLELFAHPVMQDQLLIQLSDIEQWGENVGGGGQTVSLPISFEVAFTAVVSADSSWCNASCHITTTTITTMNYQSNRPDIAQAGPVQWLALGCQLQWGFSVNLSFESQLYYQHYPISFTVGPFTNILTTVSDEVNGVVYAPTTVNWYKDKFGIVCDYYSNGAYVKPTSVTFISLGI